MRYALLLVAGLCIATSVPSPAIAQSGGQTVPLARRLFDEGVEAARKSQWDTAHDRFSRSYELAPRLKTLFNLAGAQMQTGRLVDASESYRRFLRETNDGRYEAYRADARDLLDKLEKRIPFVTLRVIGVSPGDEILLDENNFPQAGLSESMPIDPGTHSVEVKRDGKTIVSRKFTVGDGDSEKIDIVVKPRPKEVAPTELPSDETDKMPKDATFGDGSQQPRDGDSVGSGWFWTAVAVVVVGGAGAGYFFTRDLEDDPTQGTLGRGVIDVAP